MPKARKDLATRFSASLPPELLRELDDLVKEKGYANRSHAIAGMIRGQLVEHRQQNEDTEIAGSITLVYDHHRHHIQQFFNSVQQNHGDYVIATLHCHLDHHNCLEVLAVRGPAGVIRQLADQLIGARGVKHGKLAITSTGRNLPA